MFFKEKEVEKKVNAAPHAIRQLHALAKERNNPELIIQIHHILREFLKKQYKIPLSLTIEEIKKLFEERGIHGKTKLELLKLLEALGKREYENQTTPSKKEKDQLIQTCIQILNDVEKGKAHKEKRTRNTHATPIEAINKKLSLVREKPRKDWSDAQIRRAYEEVHTRYQELSDEEKVRIYPHIVFAFGLESE